MAYSSNPSDNSQAFSKREEDKHFHVQDAAEQAEAPVRRVWKGCHFDTLPRWLQDNHYLRTNHRPALNSAWACFLSIFRVHTDTVNIWTHLLGFIGYTVLVVHSLIGLPSVIDVQEILFLLYLAAAMIYFGISSAFHTLRCHSERVEKLFSVLDYCGLMVLMMVSFVSWIYHAFHCHLNLKLAYIGVVIVLGLVCLCIIVSFWDRFGRPARACVFGVFGLSAVIPILHYTLLEGWSPRTSIAGLENLVVVGSVCIVGALINTFRVPERFFPGKCDLLFQSHQIFHVFVIVAAVLHNEVIMDMVMRIIFFKIEMREGIFCRTHIVREDQPEVVY